MSADYSVNCGACGSSIYSVNITYNLGPMLREAGMGSFESLRSAPPEVVATRLREVHARLIADPVKFRRFEPANGWGSYEQAVEFCEQFAAACEQHPLGIIEGSL